MLPLRFLKQGVNVNPYSSCSSTFVYEHNHKTKRLTASSCLRYTKQNTHKKANRYLLKERIPIFHNLFKHGLNSTILFHILTICLVCYVFCFLFFACNFYTCRMLSIPYNIMDNRILVLFHVLFPYFYLLYSSIV